MRNLALAALVIGAIASPTSAQTASPLPLDAPVPADLADRDFLPSAAVAGIRDKMERVVGYWAFVKDDRIEVTTAKPNSFATGTPVITKVTLGSGKPVYDSVLTKSSELQAAIPVLNLNWNANQRAQVTITDSAQFIAGGDPSQSDWDSLPKPTNGGHWVFVDSATVSVVQSAVLTEKTGGLSAMLSALSIGGKTYQAASGTQSSLVVSLFLKRDPVRLAAGALFRTGRPEAINQTDRSFNLLSSQ